MNQARRNPDPELWKTVTHDGLVIVSSRFLTPNEMEAARKAAASGDDSPEPPKQASQS